MSNYEKPDFWSQKAQKEGYPARSIYKLKEIDEKFKLLPEKNAAKNQNFKVLDLGAAPGSWSLYVLRKFSGCGFLVSCDLCELSRKFDKGLFDGDNFFFKQADLFTQETKTELTVKGLFNLIISDAAPSTSGNGSLDSLRSLELAEGALDYARQALLGGGNFCVKIFQGGGTNEFIKTVKTEFAAVKAFKPQACRQGSFETYVIGLGKKSSNQK